MAHDLHPQRLDPRVPNPLKSNLTRHNPATARRAPNAPFYAVFRRLITAWRESRA
ncbi:hypothetical protein [Paraburkholderia sp. HP33-1]|uniref:hypothetical protein n=1 Tax=Paraburkholderia sp. HP33-1 TaxID=2883243 RepID=UPI001F2998CE|nr:hypothetical protein [Paraburkholderia sp. HP33-1]